MDDITPQLSDICIVAELERDSANYQLALSIQTLVLHYLNNTAKYTALTMQLRGYVGKKPKGLPLMVDASEPLKEAVRQFIKDNMSLVGPLVPLLPLETHVGDALYEYIECKGEIDPHHVISLSDGLYGAIECYGRIALTVYGFDGYVTVHGKKYVNAPYQMGRIVYKEDGDICITAVTAVWDLTVELYTFALNIDNVNHCLTDKYPKVEQCITGCIELQDAVLEHCPLVSTFVKQKDDYVPSQKLIDSVKRYLNDNYQYWEERIGLPISTIGPKTLIRHLRLNVIEGDAKRTLSVPMSIIPAEIDEDDGSQTFLLKIKGIDEYPSIIGYQGEYKPVNLSSVNTSQGTVFMLTVIRTKGEDTTGTQPLRLV